ncbi:hypothetical protein HY946_02415 [Candidatus Gottesmanbacteria bacterium]|nr:hypothetical protein [Candidatus Gottesmanbacteria bacterium]
MNKRLKKIGINNINAKRRKLCLFFTAAIFARRKQAIYLNAFGAGREDAALVLIAKSALSNSVAGKVDAESI